MFLRFNPRKKDGKVHRYWSVVENRRLRSGQVTQRTVLYLGEINDQQQAAWRKQLEVFNEPTQTWEQVSLRLVPQPRSSRVAIGSWAPPRFTRSDAVLREGKFWFCRQFSALSRRQWRHDLLIHQSEGED